MNLAFLISDDGVLSLLFMNGEEQITARRSVAE